MHTATSSRTGPLPTSSLPQLQAHYWRQQLALWLGTVASVAGQPRKPVIEPGRGDRRFQADEWRDNPWYSLLKQTYLLNSRLLDDMVEAADLDEKEKHKVRFYARQFIDSMSPANFRATNPMCIKLALETQGESIKAGLANLLADLTQRSASRSPTRPPSKSARNVAVSKGSVVFENALVPADPVRAADRHRWRIRPLVIVPPCINKFYILDLQPDNSFVRFACEQGQTVFLVSWRNPGAELGRHDLGRLRRAGRDEGDRGGPGDQRRRQGQCGGLVRRRHDPVVGAGGDARAGRQAVASLTLLTTMLDFRDPGDLGVFIDEQGVSQRERDDRQRRHLPGQPNSASCSRRCAPTT